jgi:ribosomal protein S18 acetylase RimI-like enzyme
MAPLPMAAAYTLRPAEAADAPVLRAVYASTRADELATTGWDAAQCQAFCDMQYDAQQAHYNRHWPDALCQLLLVPDAAHGTCVAGRLWVDRRADTVHVLDIALLPAARGQGVGSACLQDLMAEAAAAGQSLTISVETHNPARRLYDRLGFVPDGPVQGLYQRMAWHPAMARQPELQE